MFMACMHASESVILYCCSEQSLPEQHITEQREWHAIVHVCYSNTVGNVSDGYYCYTEDLLALEAASHYEVPLPGDCCLITSPPEVWYLGAPPIGSPR